LNKFEGHLNTVSCAAFSPDGKKVVTGGSDSGYIRIWETETGEEMAKFSVSEGSYIHSLAFLPNGKEILVGSSKCYIVDAESGKQVKVWEGPARFSSAAFSSDGKRVATGSVDNITRIWDLTK
jgi:WD40 repeat protein